VNIINIPDYFKKEDAMDPKKKVLLTFLSFVLAMLVIACSCSSLLPTTVPTQSSSQEPTTVPTQSSNQEPTTVPTQSSNQEPTTVPTQSSNQEPMPGLAGTWQDLQTSDTFVIEWRQNGKYMVITAIWIGPTYYMSYDITSQSWTGSALTWTYYNYKDKVSLTYETTSLSGDSLYTNWSNDQGQSGTATLSRVTIPGLTRP
jgi:hypothetical protein